MFDFKPKTATFDNSLNNDLGWLPTEFEAFQPNSKYSWQSRPMPSKDAWPIIEPKTAPLIGDLPRIIENVVKATWKFAEPKAGAERGNIIMGTRGAAAASGQSVSETYHAQVRPTTANIKSTFPVNTPIASDWNVFNQIKRTNAVSFRGDTRPPIEVISNQNGFNPPNSRGDRYYLENNIYNAFQSYLKRRFDRPLTKEDFLRAVDTTIPTAADQKLLVDYMMWRKITEREAVHLGRMVENECLKGYISTARAIDTSIAFGTAYNSKPGWLYLTVVHGGFIVPWGSKSNWGSEEAEIAQWGSIPGERIVGFVHLDRFKPDSAIFIRRSFRKSEPKAFQHMYNVMSGMTP